MRSILSSLVFFDRAPSRWPVEFAIGTDTGVSSERKRSSIPKGLRKSELELRHSPSRRHHVFATSSYRLVVHSDRVSLDKFVPLLDSGFGDLTVLLDGTAGDTDRTDNFTVLFERVAATEDDDLIVISRL